MLWLQTSVNVRISSDLFFKGFNADLGMFYCWDLHALFPQISFPTAPLSHNAAAPIVSFQVFCPLTSLKVYLDALNWSPLLLSLYIYHLEEEFVRWSWPQRHTAGGEAGRVTGGETVKVEEDERRSADHLKDLKNVSGFSALVRTWRSVLLNLKIKLAADSRSLADWTNTSQCLVCVQMISAFA